MKSPKISPPREATREELAAMLSLLNPSLPVFIDLGELGQGHPKLVAGHHHPCPPDRVPIHEDTDAALACADGVTVSCGRLP
jgi:hypothetical protein